LHLATFEAIDLIFDGIVDLGDLGPQIYLLLSSSHLFLPDPAIDTSDLRLQIRIDRLNSLVFALELIANI